MCFKALIYAYVLGGITLIPLVILGIIFYTLYTAVPIGDLDVSKARRGELERQSQEEDQSSQGTPLTSNATPDTNDLPKPRKGWLTVRRTFEEVPTDASYVGLVRGFLDARSKDPKRSRPKGMWYVVLKGKILYLYEDETMTECEAAIELGGHDVVIYPEGLPDGELFAKRNAICLKPKIPPPDNEMPSVTREMKFTEDEELTVDESGSEKHKAKERVRLEELEAEREEAREQALEISTPWFIFVRSNVEMEDWYHTLVHASDHPANIPTLAPLSPVFQPADMNHLVNTLDEQPDVIPMRWLNAILGRLFFSFYRTQTLESYIIGRLMKKLSKIKRPGFLTHIVVREVSVGDKAPTLSKPMLKELTKEGDASMEVHLHYKGEIRITVEAIATINLGARFKTYAVKLVLAAVLRELEGNLLVKVKRPPSNRLWYAFTTMPRMVLDVEPVVSDRQITWSMILSTIESRLKEVIQESVVLPNMDDIAFFESLQYSRRGGIYAEASRSEKAPSLFPEPHEEERVPASEPLTESTTPLRSPSPEPKLPLHRSHSAEEAQSESLKIVEPASLPRPVTFNATGIAMKNSSSSSSSTSTKRRSWLTAVREPSSDDPFSDTYEEPHSRGRQNGVDNTHRTPSLHDRNGAGPSASQPHNQEGESISQLKPIPIRRTSSRRSQSSSTHGAASEPSSVEDASTHMNSDSLLSAFHSRSPSGSAPKKEGPLGSSTFFQTLKSRDKQAISNTAKEAMRKWGVNWGGLKKDNAPTITSSGDEGQEAEHRHADEPGAQKHRPSYAEVRAAVEQRKERERTHGDHFGPSDSEATLQGVHTRSRPGSSGVSSDGHRSPSPTYLSGASLSPSTSPRPPVEDVHADTSLPISPRPRTTSRLSNTRPEGDSGTTGSLPDEVEHPSDIPIHTRPPQPKTMTIPGIHASHRGEVMSMGYAPPPVPSEPKKAPAIQSVYRLWKNNTAPGQQGPQSPPQVQTGFAGNDQDALPAPSTSSGPSSQPEVAPRPIPPPLPPRSNTAHALQTKAESSRAVESEPGTSPASAALQSIVSKDRNKRESIGPMTSSSIPPSPGRREEATDHVVSSSIDGVSTAASTFIPGSTPTASASTPALSTVEAGANVSPKPPALPPRRVQASA
ncbi:unnamed protein product [Somion occarium]|uniref:SMP-LTD domain-containing protein n=2 Tax=Somion occarium TaxID=3059160 RepID=A0ABP1CHX5_9APHY